MKKITIFGYASGCVYCDMAKRLCDTRQMKYDFVELAREEETEQQKQNREKLNGIISKKQIAQRTFPFVFVGDDFVGGFEEFRQSLI